MWGDHMRSNVVCLVGAHDWSGWEVLDPQRPAEQVRTCARCLCAQRSGDRMRSKLACLAGAHDWSEWRVLDLQQPSEQARTCARCLRTKNKAAIVPLRTWTSGLE
jgi:tRNA U38,U39,U40 pseudouridine synthase TruA